MKMSSFGNQVPWKPESQDSRSSPTELLAPFVWFIGVAERKGVCSCTHHTLAEVALGLRSINLVVPTVDAQHVN